ncbi:MAG: CTB family bacteriocin [Cyanobacteria bacterium P01_A01_bin.84]
MSEEIKNTAIELSADELDEVAGGLSLLPFDSQNAGANSNSNFETSVLQIAQENFSGAGGSGNKFLLNAANVKSSSSQDFNFSQ